MQTLTDIGSKVLENYYHVEAFAPISFSRALEIIGPILYGEFFRDLEEVSVVRDGERLIPVGLLAEIVPVDEEMKAELFSVPMWIEDLTNLVVDEGLNDSLDKHLKGSAYTAAWYVGITASAPSFAAGNTMASHVGWTENTTYSNANRPTLTLGTVSGKSVDNSASKAVFNINGTTTAGGAFVVANNTKGGTTGILYGGAAFAADRSLLSGDTLNVTVTCTAA